ncbi:hypothetical protein WA026_013911 [Henosepilachna vigintioctopunctata]|uniref:Uncharacterized protein n=1 Tax=Henosepilachna vigintioctopunctata TaxID=420089 RepID=A0AAW1U696_9CUCU
MTDYELQKAEEEIYDEGELSEEGVVKRITDCHDRGPPCNRRIDELAMPSKRLLLCTFRDFGYMFPREWNERIRELLSILYAMTPEETEKYFEQLRAVAKHMALRKKMKEKLKKLVAKKKKREMKQKAYILFKNIIKMGLMHAATQDVPPLVSVRMRNLSNIILQQLADLRGVDLPQRQHPDKLGSFLISIADWIAIAVENVYYRVQLKKNEELEEIEQIEMSKLEEERRRERKFKKGRKVTSTPNQSREKTI